jgi:citrate lyase subunit beta / citryl-CoA lyase
MDVQATGRKAMADGGDIIRSMVMVSGVEPQEIAAAARTGVDCVCIDLEDLVVRDRKEEARSLFAEAAQDVVNQGARVMVRTNSLEGGAEADLEAIVGPLLHGVNLPKAEYPDRVAEYCSLVERLEAREGLAKNSIRVRPIVETARGVKFAYEIAAASSRIAYMGGCSGGWWGDLGASLWHQDTADGLGTFYVRAKVLVDVRAADVPFPVGGGPIGSDDLDDMRAFFQENRVLGYTGVHCGRDEALIQLANEVFRPTQQELEQWSECLPALEEATSAGESSAWVAGKHLDVSCLPRLKANFELAKRISAS